MAKDKQILENLLAPIRAAAVSADREGDLRQLAASLKFSGDYRRSVGELLDMALDCVTAPPGTDLLAKWGKPKTKQEKAGSR